MKASGLSDPSRDREMIAALRSRRFDAAVIFTVYSQNPLASAMLCHLAEIPLRLAHCRENPYQLLTDWIPEKEPLSLCRHEVRRQLDLVATVGARTANERLSFRVPETDRERVEDLLEDAIPDRSEQWIVVHPGASAPARRYPAESFSRVADLIARDLGYRVLFTGSEAERDLIESIQARMTHKSVSLAGLLGLGELAALIEMSPVLVSNNTGPVHVAAAVGTPVVDLYALTNPQHTPWAVENRVLFHDVPCKYCYKSVCPEGHHNCLRLISPESVIGAVAELLVVNQEKKLKCTL
jgi:lipopolysaccharide heptosyltransferase II